MFGQARGDNPDVGARGLVVALAVSFVLAACGGGRVAAVWTAHDKQGWTRLCTRTGHQEPRRCGCYQQVFERADKTYDEIHKAVLDSAYPRSVPPLERSVFDAAARACPAPSRAASSAGGAGAARGDRPGT